MTSQKKKSRLDNSLLSESTTEELREGPKNDINLRVVVYYAQSLHSNHLDKATKCKEDVTKAIFYLVKFNQIFGKTGVSCLVSLALCSGKKVNIYCQKISISFEMKKNFLFIFCGFRVPSSFAKSAFFVKAEILMRFMKG